MPKLSLTKKYITYPKYKDSGIEWVCDVPEGWDVATSRRLFQTKKQLASETESQTVLSLTLQGVIPRVLDGSGKNPANYDTYQEFQKDDLVFCLFDYDVTPRTIGYVGENGMMTGAYTRLIPKAETSSRFFYYYFLYLDYTKELLHLCTGLRNSISKPVFWSLKNPLPPKEEQEKIARFLDEQTARIDETIAKKERLIELLKEKRTATINHAVTKGLDPKAELVDSGIDWIGKIPKGWEVKKLKTLVSIFGRIGFRGYTTEDIVPAGEGAISLSPGNISDNKLSTDNSTYISLEKYEESPEIKVKAGDILFVKTGSTIGKVAYVDSVNEPTTINPQLVVMKRMKANPKFLAYSLYSKYFSFQNNLNTFGGSTPSLSQSKLGSYSVLVPSPHEQQKIVTYLDEKTDVIERVINSVMKSIVLLQEFKSSLISHAVTGKIKA